jgi:hypothetical protein
MENQGVYFGAEGTFACIIYIGITFQKLKFYPCSFRENCNSDSRFLSDAIYNPEITNSKQEYRILQHMFPSWNIEHSLS